MQLVHRSILVGAAAVVLLSGCDFSNPWGSSSGGSEYGATAVGGTTGGTGGGGKTGGGGTSPVGGVGGEGTTQGTDDTVIAAASTSLVSVAVGASQTVSVTFNSSDGLAVTGFGISGSLGSVLPAGWSGPSTFTCPLVSTGSGCVLNLTYAPTATDSGTVTLTYIYVDNAGLSKVPGGTITIPYQSIAANNVVATASPSGQVNAAVGAGMQSVSVTFTTDSGNATLDNAASNLSVTTDLTTLPAGWSSAAPSFACALVSSGNGCQLLLSYAPSARGSGTLTLDYTYMDDTGTSRTGAIQIPYSTTSADTVTATASPAGQITAAIKGGSQSVAVTFDTDDGKTASNLFVTTALGSLPAGWHSAAGSFKCGSVSTGNGCQLRLTYAPAALASGTLTLNYAYDDDTGAAQTGTLDVPYEATTNDNVTATPSPTGQINAVVGMGSQPVTVVFTTDDGRLATNLQITSGLATLPAGWTSSANPFACATLSSGSGCQLTLTYNPLAADAGTLTLGFSYTNNANQTKTGSLAIAYRATTDDTIAGTPAPSASLAVLTGTSTPVTVSFVTDDANPASDLTITSGLSALPAGWTSSATTFSCATVSDGTVCQLPLTYAPTAVDNGTLALGFSYTNDAGYAKTNTVNILYRANSDDTVAGTVSPAPLSASVAAATPVGVTVTFVTSDLAPAGPFSVTSDLTTTLPAGWSGPASFTCPTVSNGTPCQLSLSWLPTVVGGGSFQLNYGYNDNAGTAATGSVTVSFTATP
jgi:hypothetical protein